MKIIHIVSGLKVGGAEQVLLKLIIESKDVDHTVIALSREGKMQQKFNDAKINLIIIDFKKNPILNLILLKRIITQTKPDIVQTWLYHADLIGGLTARLAGVKNIIWGIRTTDLKKGSYSTSIIRKLNAWLSYFIPKKIICVAEASMAKHIRIGYCKKKMLVIPNGFNLDKLYRDSFASMQLRKGNGIEQDEIVIGSVGRFSQVKGQDIFVKAAGIVAEKNMNVKFLMVGRDLDTSNKELMNWINATGKANQFILLGERSDINICYGAMDIFCMHSRSEGFPNALGEAMAIGLPCISTDVGDAKLLGGKNISLTEPNNSILLAEVILQMISYTKAELRLIGKSSRERILENYSITSMLRAYEEFYNKLRD